MASAPSAVRGRRRYATRLSPPERRDQVLDAALRLVVTAGFGAVTMQALAREAGVTRPVVYDLFANRDEVVAALIRREEERALLDLAALPTVPDDPASTDPVELMAITMEAFLAAVRDRPDTWRLIYQPIEGAPASLRQDVQLGEAMMYDQIKATLELVFRGLDVDIEVVTHMAQGFARGCAQLILLQPEEYPPERIGRAVRQMLHPFHAVIPAS